MAPRANWKGFLKIAEVVCPVSLYSAISSSERIAFHTINRATGHRVHRQFVDSENGDVVEREDQVKGYELGSGEYVVVEPEEVAAAVPQSDKTLSVETFIARESIDQTYLDRPYYLAPSDRLGLETFVLIREGLRKKNVVALAKTVLFRRVRTVLISPYRAGLMAETMNFDYEVRSAKDAFSEIPAQKTRAEMRELAEHIIRKMKGRFDPSKFTDRYEDALAALVKAKLEGRKLPAITKPVETSKSDLMDALRKSAGLGSKAMRSEGAKPSRKPRAKHAAPRRKAS